MLNSDYLLITDKATVKQLLESCPTDKQLRLDYASKMSGFSDDNLKKIKADMERKIIQYERQLTNATYWTMARDIAKQELIG